MKNLNLIQAIYDAVETEWNKGKHEHSQAHYPSSASDCRRKLWWKWQNEPVSDPILPPAMLKMELGNKLHDFLFRLLRGKYEIKNEIPFKANVEGLKYPFSGRIDNKLLINGEAIGLEIKTTFGRAITSIKEKGIRSSDLSQIAVYLNCTDITAFVCLYFARDSGFMQDIVITRENVKAVWKDIIKRLQVLEKHLEDKTLPERDFEKKDWQCKYCVYQKKCQEVENG